MPMMVTVAVVIAKHAAIVNGTQLWIDISKAVLCNSAVIEPDFFLQHRTPSDARKIRCIVDPLFELA